MFNLTRHQKIVLWILVILMLILGGIGCSNDERPKSSENNLTTVAVIPNDSSTCSNCCEINDSLNNLGMPKAPLE